MKSILRAIALLSLAACGFVSSGSSISVDINGELWFNGVKVPFHRWVEVVPGDAPTKLQLATGTGPITISGGEALRLEAELFSEVEGDGTVELIGGKLVARSAAGHALCINGVRGEVRAGTFLELDSGTGEVRLQDVAGSPFLEIDTGTGRVSLQGCVVGELKIDTGTGEVQLDDCTVERLDADLGTGDVHVRGSRVGRTEIDSGTGDVILTGGSDMGKASYDLGTGDVRNDG